MREDKTIRLRDGRTLAYGAYGDPKGKPLFFFHGWPSCRMHGIRYHTFAKKQKVRLIVPDRPGFGNSTFQKNRTLLDWPDDVLELADHLGIKKFAIVGISGGGPYAAVCAYKIPNRITKAGIVVGLAPTNIPGILNGMGFFNKFGWANYQRIPGLAMFSSWLCWFQVTYLPYLSTLGFRAKQDQAMINSTFRKVFVTTLKEAFKQGIQGPALDLKLYTNEWGFRLQDINVKTYLWYGENDRNVSLAMGKYYASQIRGSKLTIYPNEGHLCQISHAEEIIKTLVS